MLGDSEPVGAAISHGRPDHVGALAEIRAKLGVPVLTHRVTEGVKADRWLGEGDMVEVGDHRLWVRHAPEHSDDRVCYGIEGDNRVIVGDAS
jgi:glyoxylase-like metal-dependent hydrolase (beta-lactamase superfamily II)